MKKKVLIIIAIILSILLIITFIKMNFIKRDSVGDVTTPEKSNEKEIKYDEDTGLYYVINKETGEIFGASTNESDLHFWKMYPDYNPDPSLSRSTYINDFLHMEDSNESLIE